MDKLLIFLWLRFFLMIDEP